jgi:hypothetical protein
MEDKFLGTSGGPPFHLGGTSGRLSETGRAHQYFALDSAPAPAWPDHRRGALSIFEVPRLQTLLTVARFMRPRSNGQDGVLVTLGGASGVAPFLRLWVSPGKRLGGQTHNLPCSSTGIALPQILVTV